MDIKLLKARARNLPVTLQVGKNGITKGVLDEIDKQLKKKRLVKIKILKNILENTGRDEIIGHILKNTNSELVSSIGNVLVLRKQ